MKNFNYHTHTYRCGHAQKDITDEDFINEFIKKGFEKIAFTDHCPQKQSIDKRNNMRMEYSQINEYLDSINYLKNKYKDKIEIQSGFEIEYLPGEEENLLELKQMTDKLILGQHFIYDDNNIDLKIFRRDDFTEQNLIKYANYIKKAIELGIPDIIVHPDLYMVNKNEFGKIEREVAEIICKEAEKYDIPLEINLTATSMYLSKIKDKIKYPCREFWEVASNYNVKVIYGIDAHYKKQIEQYEESIDLVNKIIGNKTIKKLKFSDGRI